MLGEYIKEELYMDYKTLVADIIVYSIKRVEMAEFDLNITREEVFEGEIQALTNLLSHIEIMLSGEKEPDSELKHSMSLVNEVLEELKSGKGTKHLDRWKQS